MLLAIYVIDVLKPVFRRDLTASQVNQTVLTGTDPMTGLRFAPGTVVYSSQNDTYYQMMSDELRPMIGFDDDDCVDLGGDIPVDEQATTAMKVKIVV